MIRNVLARDLRAVAREVDAYPDDEALWRTAPGITNSAGTLALHLAGNLEHFVGSVLGTTGYVRDRQAEFATRALTRAEVRGRIEAAAKSVDATLAQLESAQWEAGYPVPIGGRSIGTGVFLMHLATHLAYHLGQIDYHRRMVAASAGTVDAMSIGELPQR
jgi:uncharacterized damage-inducible protein DinB